MEINIREYQKPDKNELIRLMAFLQDFEHHVEPEFLDKGLEVATELVQILLNDADEKNGKILFAEVNGKIVGFVSGHVSDEVELKEKKYFYISNLAILPEFQNHGIGKMLLEKIVEYADNLGLKLIEINVLNKNAVAFEIYKKIGFREYEKVLIKEVNKK